jgi:hypothetical protein
VPRREQHACYLPGPPAPREGSVRGAISCEASQLSRRPCEARSRSRVAAREHESRRSLAGWTDQRLAWPEKDGEMGGNAFPFSVMVEILDRSVLMRLRHLSLGAYTSKAS